MVNRLNRKNSTSRTGQVGAIALGIMAIGLPGCALNEEVVNGYGANVTKCYPRRSC
jgi:hypothetical protein